MNEEPCLDPRHAVDGLQPADRAWLEAALLEYREALEYLRQH